MKLSEFIVYFVFGLSIFIAPVFIFGVLPTWRTNREAQKEARRQREATQRQHEAEQQWLHQRLLSLVNESTTIFQNLPVEIDKAERALSDAEEEFADGAFSPFWAAIERSVTHLAHFNHDIKQITNKFNYYESEKNKLDSAPPAFRLNINTLPDATCTADRMRSIVRPAHKDPHFATIYEQRRTSQILVEGFTSLGQAIDEMSYRLESSIGALEKSFSGSISNLAASNRENAREITAGVDSVRGQLESDAKSRRDHEARERVMLDNIQRRRKP